ncbi:MAG: class I SAM-dependent DNA methyltransferase, partial [Salinarimonas sp.]
AEEELLSALVALNQERQREEQQGRVRWLRPDFQIPRLAHKLPEPPDEQLFADLVLAPQDLRIKWPKDTAEQLRLVRRLLIATPSPAPDIAIAEAFSGKGGRQRRAHVRDALEALAARGIVRKIKGETSDRYFIPR